MNLNEALRIFGMDENYTLELIKKKYKILILKHHPDKGGCSDTFIKIHEAYHYLLNYTKENNSIPYKEFYLDIHFFMKDIFEKYNIKNEILNGILLNIKEMLQPEKIIIIRPSLKQLMEGEVYVLEYENKTYYIPLWETEHIYHLKDKDLIIQCIPKLEEHIQIDHDNNIIVKVFENKDKIKIGNKIMNTNEKIIYNQGIPRYQQYYLDKIIFSDIIFC